LKIIFAGTPQFAVSALEALLEKNHEVVAVLTQPDRSSGRGMQLVPSPVKQSALANNLIVMQPPTLKSQEVQRQLAELNADVMVVAAYGLILPLPVLQIPKYGCLNIHASLLPRWRGAAPIQRAILAGDEETGITIMQMDEGLDTGKMLLKTPCHINIFDTAQTLHDKLAKLGAQAITEILSDSKLTGLTGEVQAETQATYAAKLNKLEAELDWTQSAAQILRAIRAFNPAPGAYTYINSIKIKIWQAGEAEDFKGEPGTITGMNKNGIQVACGKGTVNLQYLQKPNGKSLPSYEFAKGFKLNIGDRFKTP
jgi:methionyl-tRNA formyltransferase